MPEEQQGGETPLVDITSLSDTLADEMPTPQEHAMQSMEENAQPSQSVTDSNDDQPRDPYGRTFSEALHKTKKGSDEPLLTKHGKLVCKPGMKPDGAAPARDYKAENDRRKASYVGGQPKEPTPAELESAKARATGRVAATMLISLGTAIGGDEWEPMVKPEYGLDERKHLEAAFADYFEATGRTDFPPGAALSIAVGSYILPRFSKPKTQARVGGFFGWVKKKYVAWKTVRVAKKHGVDLRPVGESKSEGE